MASKPADASRNLVDSIQHAVGVNVVDIGAWLGPAAAAAWIWLPVITGDVHGQLPSPLTWADSILRDLGVIATWPASAQRWLAERPSLFWVAIGLATYAAGRELVTRSSTSSITWAAIMTAACIKSPIVTFSIFLTASLALAAAAQLLDLAGGSEFDPNWYLMRWISGPGVTVALVFGAPVFLVAGLIAPYRERALPRGEPGGELGAELSNMTDDSVADTPAREVLGFLARVLLVSDDHRGSAYRTIKYHSQFFDRRAVVGSPLDRRGWRQAAEVD